MMKNMTAIFQKQVRDTFKNKTILIQFVMFPLLTVIMENAVELLAVLLFGCAYRKCGLE